jgi:arginine deiminase
MTFRVQSEVGHLRQAIVHRPGLELSRLTPQNIGGLLFDDVLWGRKAKEEHDVFTEALRERGVTVHYFGQLLAEALEVPAGREFILDRVCTPETVGPALVAPLHKLAEDLDGLQLADYLVGGILKADLRPLRAPSLKWDTLRADDFLLPPLPNHLFPRDNSCWVYGGVSVNPMAKPARQRARPGPWRAPLHDLPDRTRPRLSQEQAMFSRISATRRKPDADRQGSSAAGENG